MRNFIKIQDERIRCSAIKKYKPLGDKQLNVYFNTSRYKIEVSIFSFTSTRKRNEMLNAIDTIMEI